MNYLVFYTNYPRQIYKYHIDVVNISSSFHTDNHPKFHTVYIWDGMKQHATHNAKIHRGVLSYKFNKHFRRHFRLVGVTIISSHYVENYNSQAKHVKLVRYIATTLFAFWWHVLSAWFHISIKITISATIQDNLPRLQAHCT